MACMHWRGSVRYAGRPALGWTPCPMSSSTYSNAVATQTVMLKIVLTAGAINDEDERLIQNQNLVLSMLLAGRANYSIAS